MHNFTNAVAPVDDLFASLGPWGCWVLTVVGLFCVLYLLLSVLLNPRSTLWAYLDGRGDQGQQSRPTVAAAQTTAPNTTPAPPAAAVRVLARAGREHAATDLQRLIDDQGLSGLRRDRVAQVEATVEDADRAYRQLPAQLRTANTDDGTTPTQDYHTILDRAVLAIDSLTNAEAEHQVDEIRALRNYAQQWSVPDALTIDHKNAEGDSK